MQIFWIGAPGGSACNCNRSNFNSVLGLRMGTGKVKTLRYSLASGFVRVISFKE